MAFRPRCTQHVLHVLSLKPDETGCCDRSDQEEYRSIHKSTEPDKFAPRAIAAHVECRRAIPAGGYRSELRTDGALPRPARSSTTQDSLRSQAELEGRRSERYRKSNPIQRNASESSLPARFSTASSVSGQGQLRFSVTPIRALARQDRRRILGSLQSSDYGSP